MVAEQDVFRSRPAHHISEGIARERGQAVGVDQDFGLGIRIEGSIDDVSPIHEIGDGGGIETKALLRDHRDKTAPVPVN